MEIFVEKKYFIFNLNTNAINKIAYYVNFLNLNIHT